MKALGGRKVVTVLNDGKATPTVVTTGAVGVTYTAINSGLKLGETVVLADLAEPLPTGANGTSTRIGAGDTPGFGGDIPRSTRADGFGTGG